jgi:phthiocerol/phenolphthiocerol synthesis type-I polyketide synthase E
VIEGNTLEETRETGLEVAVIGMAGRFPGAGDIDEFWNNLKDGVESITFFSDDELAEAGIDNQTLKHANYVKANGLLENIEYFDSLFFGFTPREAEIMDPQVRLFLECAWHALEDAAYDPDTYRGFIGLYAGASAHFNWYALTILSGAGSTIDPFSAGQLKEKDFMSVHASYRLNLKGPSIIMSTACSTSLVAVVLACQGLLSGECDMALAGGVTARVPRKTGYLHQEGMIASPDGHCRAFDAGAAGTVSGNGVGVVVLKLLEKAREDQDHIYAVIKGSAANNDGLRKAGFMAPSVDGQAEVIKAALRMADVPVESITCVEAHGTGTALGDPVEIEALKLAFDTDKKGFCALGSVKTNIGHLDSAAGIAGFIKAVLALYHRQIPPSLHFEKPNPKIDFQDSPFYVSAKRKEWQANGFPLRAGVSSFGIGGTNAHVVLQEWREDRGEEDRREKEECPRLIVLSAKTETALNKMTENLVDYLKQSLNDPGNPVNLANFSYTLQVGRKRFPHRRTAVCSTVDEAVEVLSNPGSPQRYTFFSTGDKRPVIFMFPGQGAQYVDMGRQLYQQEPVFRKEMDRCFEILNPLMNYDLKEILYRSDRSDSSDINRTEITQPLIFVFEYALAKLLMAWGIGPYAMIGHSIGEYTAAHLSGVFSLEQALKLVVLRGNLMQQMPAGSMLSVSLAEEALTPLLALTENAGAALAAVNSPGFCTVSGPDDAIAALEKQLQEKGCECRRLHTSHAFHSAMMDPILDQFEAAVRDLSPGRPQIPYISNLTGNWITVDQAADPVYWANHLRRTVRFGDGVSLLLKEENSIFLEVGPGMVLSTFVNKHSAKTPFQKVLNLVRHPKEKLSDHAFLLNKIGQLWLYGQTIDWKGFYAPDNDVDMGREKVKPQRLSMPKYPFERQRYWIDRENFQLPPSIPKKTDMADWFYQPSWKQVRLPRPETGTPSPPFVCLVFTPGTGPASLWGGLLEKQGVPVIEVREGSDFMRHNGGSYSLVPGEPDHYDRLFQHLAGEKRTPQWIIHLWNIVDVKGAETGNRDMDIDIDRALDRGYYSLLNLARAIGKHNPEDPVLLAVVTDRMQDVTGESALFIERSLLIGPVKTIPLEYPNIDCRSIDFADIREEEALIRLVTEMRSNSPDKVIAFRDRIRWVQGVEPLRLEDPGREASPPLPGRIRQGGVYLITGGLGGMGLELAGFLAERVKARLVLTARSPFPPREQWRDMDTNADKNTDTAAVLHRIRKVGAIEEKGGEVLILNADAADRQQMESVVRQAEKRFGPINGIIHTAGTADGAMIQLRTREMSERVLAAKTRGTLILDALFGNRPLDFFVLCSSLASIINTIGQVAYTAANCFLDTYARWKSTDPGCPWKENIVSINWDTWREAGMAVEAAGKLGRNTRLPLETGLSSGEGCVMFGRILEENLPQVITSSRDLQRLLNEPIEPPGSRADAPAARAGETAGPAGTVYRRPELSSEYVAPGTEEERMLASYLQQLLGIDRVGIYDNFFELGLSSLDVINITNRLKEAPGIEISTVIVFENPTVYSLARCLEARKANKGEEAPPLPVKKKDREKEIHTGKDRLKQILKKTREAPDGR